MACNLKMLESVLAIIILVFSFLDTAYSKWIVVLAGAFLLLHALMCKGHK